MLFISPARHNFGWLNGGPGAGDGAGDGDGPGAGAGDGDGPGAGDGPGDGAGAGDGPGDGDGPGGSFVEDLIVKASTIGTVIEIMITKINTNK